MSMVDFFFSGSYRESLGNNSRPQEKRSFKNELKEGSLVEVEIFKVRVCEVNDSSFMGVIIDQDHNHPRAKKKFISDRKLLFRYYAKIIEE